MPAGVAAKPDALDLLAEASARLASSVELSVTLPQVADLCVSRLADYCAIAADHGDAGGISLVEAAREPGVRIAMQDCDRAHELLEAAGYESVVVTPLTGRQEPLGIFVIASREKGAFDGQTQKLAKVLALQIANAIDQSLLFERTYRVADRLQRALLPDSFPRVRGASFHAAYRPASDEAEVGGDWYDAFALPDGRIAISMGDVAGHGLEAATVMGEIRQAMRSTAVNQQSPAAVLEHINSVISLRKGIGMVTAIFGYYEPVRRELTYAVAGHPPPVLAAAGAFNGFLPGGGVPLGVEAAVRASDWTVALPPRSCVVFYTDGMTEYSRDVIVGEQRLIEASARAFESDPENPALALQERIFDAQINRDDAATLTLSCHDGPVPETVTISAIPLAAPLVRAMLHRLCDANEIPEPQRFSLITAVGEAVANAVEHGYRGVTGGMLQIRTSVDEASVVIEVEDRGHWRPFQKREERGRGIMLMHELMDRVRITSEQNRTVVTLCMNRPAEAEEATS